MAYTIENNYTGNGSTTLFSFTFPYLETTDIKVSVNQVVQTLTTHYTIASPTQINFVSAPTAGQAIRIYRDTDISALQSEFFSGSAVRAQDLNDDFNQTLYVSQETQDKVDGHWNDTTDTLDSSEAFEDVNTKIMTAAAIDDRINANIASHSLTDGKIWAGNVSNVGAQVTPSGDVTMSNTGAFTIANGSVEHVMLAGDAVDGDNIANDSIDSEHYVDGSIDTAHIADSQITTAKIGSGQVNAGSLASDAVETAKIADGNITTVKLATDAVTAAKLADDAVGADQLADNTIVNTHISSSAAIDHNKLANFGSSGGGYILVGNDSQVPNAVAVSGDVTLASNGAVTIANDAVGADQLAANAVVNDSVASGAAIAHNKLANVTDGQILVGNVSNVPTAVAVSGDVTIANTGAVTIANDAVEIGMIGCEQTTISDSDSHIPTSGAVVDYVAAQIAPIGGLEVIADDESFPNTIPAAGVVISITDAAGLSVNSSGVSTNGDALDNSTITINNFPTELRGGATVGGVTNADPYVFGSGAGLMVQSTGSSHTYNYHQALIRETDFVRLSGDIDDFNQRYRVAASAAGVRTGVCGADGTGSGSYPCDGDMCWFTGSSKMYVFDAPAASTSNSDLDAAWKEVSSVGDYKILTVKDNGEAVDGAGPTFNASNTQYDLFDGSADASITNAQQLIVVLNGVIQKPNSGSYSGSEEGFYLDGSDGIRFCDGPPSGSSLFVTQIGAATTISTPGTGSINASNMFAAGVINAAAIGTGAVEHAKLDADCVDGDNIGDDVINSEHIAAGAIDLEHMSSESVDEDNLHISNAGSNGQFLSKQSGNSGGLTWATVSSTPEGTAILSTGESGGTKFLREDGDNSCSWQTVPAATTTSGTDNFTIADGNLIIATAGHGIDFSATADAGATGATATAELLDWYEYGDWTPTFEGSGSATMVTQYGKYTRIGNMCHAYCLVGWSTYTGSGAIIIGGMPFDTAHNYSPATFGAWDDQIQLRSGYTWPSVYCGSPWDRDYFYLHEHKGDNVSAATTNILAASNQTFGLSCYYRV